MIKEPAWLPAARALPYGTKTKIRCTECGTDKTLMVSHGTKGCSAYCFRASCGFTDFRPHGELSLAQLRQRQLDTEALQRSNVVALPSDCTDDLSAPARVWLLKAGVNEHLRSTYGIQYSPRYDRVILPVRKDGKLLGYTARALNGASPKYIAKFADPSNAVFLSDPKLMLKDTDAQQKGPIEFDLIVTEDILSAIRVGRTVPSAAILGTAFTDAHMSRLRSALAGTRHRVGVWTDGDAAGRNSSLRIRRMLQLCGCEVRPIRTTRDPKFHSNREIRLCLSSTV
jgi:hypothetical protein